MSEPLAPITLLRSTSSAEASLVRTSAARVRARALLESAAACGVSTLVSWKNAGPDGLWLRTWRRGLVAGWTPWCLNWHSSAMKRYRSLCRRRMSEHLIVASASSLWPTPSATRYGSNRGGAAGRVGKERFSLDTMAKRGLLPTPSARDWKSGKASEGGPGGLLSPRFVEWMMGFPIGWTSLPPSATPSSPSVPKSSAG